MGRKILSTTANAAAPEILTTDNPPSPSGVAIAAMVSSNMAAVSDLILCVAILQKQPRLLVAFLVEVMQQRRIGVARQLFRQFVNAREQRQQARFWIRRGH